MTDHPMSGGSVDLSWRLDDTIMDGTLVRPSGAGPFPAVVMVAGSGPTDRDWNSPLLPGTNGSARLLAAALAQAGFASLRYDKRGIGPHATENLRVLAGNVSMQSFTDEVASAVGTLASQADVRADRIFALANSEGTLHALKYQAGNPEIPLAGLVLIGPPGRSVGAVARAQLAAQAASIPNGEVLLRLYDTAIDRFQAGEPIDPDPALPQGVQTLLRGLEAPVNLPFARELWLANAAPLLRLIGVPILVIIGKKDMQVDWEDDGEPLRHAAQGRDQVTFRFPENANHVLKYEPHPRSELTAAIASESYNGPDTRLDPEALSEIIGWLTVRT